MSAIVQRCIGTAWRSRALLGAAVVASSWTLLATSFTSFAQSAKDSQAKVCADQYRGNSYSAPAGTTVPVADDGVVVAISHQTSFGRYSRCDRYVVVLHRHANGKRAYSRYGELGVLGSIVDLPITVGTRLKRGQEVGKVGARGEFHFEVRPIPTTIAADSPMPNWTAVVPDDPSKFSFASYESLGAVTPERSTWSRYQVSDPDEFFAEALGMFGKDQGGIKVFPNPAAVRLRVQLVATPITCSTAPLQRAVAMVSRAIPGHTNTCVSLKTLKGKVFRAYIQDAVADYLAREVGLNESVELFAVHVYTSSPIEGGEVGLVVNEFNVIP